MNRVLLNGTFVSREMATVDIEDRGYQFGDGVYEVVTVYEGKLFELDAHLERLERSAREIGITMPYSISELGQQLVELCEANQLKSGIVYMQISRGVAPRAHPYPPATVLPQIVAYTKQLQRPVEIQKSGVRAILSDDIRWLRCDIKSLNLLGNVMAKQKAVEHGAFECILHRGDIVTEGSSTNVFMVKNNVVYTHPANHLILKGITREVIFELCEKLNISIKEESFTVEQLRGADEVFISSSTIEAVPVVEVEGTPIGSGQPGPTTRLIQEQFTRLIHEWVGK